MDIRSIRLNPQIVWKKNDENQRLPQQEKKGPQQMSHWKVCSTILNHHYSPAFVCSHDHMLPLLIIYLVGGIPTPLKKYESQLELLFPIYRKMKNVPNHQPAINIPLPEG